MKLSSTLCSCGKNYPNFNYFGMSAKYCSECKKENMIDVKHKMCECGKCQPTYNYEGLIAKYCIDCKKDNMIDVKHKLCNCGKVRPSFNFVGLKAEYCSSCKLDNMIDINEKRFCKICNETRPSFNYPDLKPEYCSKCKINGMIDVIHDTCECGKCQPTYNYEGLIANYCIDCKKDNMIDVNHKLCNCGKARPSFNFVGLKAEYCTSCKLDNMININEKRFCKICNETRSSFNYPDLKPEYCSKCKIDGMIIVLSNLCNCGKAIPIYNFKGLKREYCGSCKKEGMINVKSMLCKGVNCETQGNKNYKGYCTNCFQHLFPNDPLTFQIRSKTKEIAVRDFINSRFEGFQHDKPLWYNESACDCTTKRRIDHRKLINDTLLCIETDENQHKYYSKEDENARYNDLFMAYGGKFIFIRFNPDKYVEDGKSRNPMLVNRLPVLESEINKQIKRIEMSENAELLEVIELYYDKK
jgi:hypothetical protein